MRKALTLVLTLTMILSLAACGQSTKQPKTQKWINAQYNSAVVKFDPAAIEIHNDISKTDCQTLDAKIWEYMTNADKYVHAYDRYYDNHKIIRSEKDKIIKITEEIDAKYPYEMDLSGYNLAYAEDYITAANHFFDATQKYSLYIVSYAQFGGSDYLKLLERYERLVDQYREEVIAARLQYLASVDLFVK